MDISPGSFQKRFQSIIHNEQDAMQILHVAQMKRIEKDNYLIKYKEYNDTLYFIWAGGLHLYITTGKTRLSIGTVGPGHWVGELGFIDPGNAMSDVIADEDTSVLVLDQEGLKTLLENSPNTVNNLLQALSLDIAARLRESRNYVLKKTDEHSFDLMKKDIEQKENWFRKLGHRLTGLTGE